MKLSVRNIGLISLRFAPMLIFVFVMVLFGSINSRFLALDNFVKIIDQSAPVAIIAVGMTFVLLTAGIDLSVGSAMYVVAAVCGLYFSQVSLWLMIPAMMLAGALIGAINASAIVGFRVAPFIVTLATLSIFRGVGRWLTDTATVNMSEDVTGFSRLSFLSIPTSIWLLGGVIGLAWMILRQTGFGRSIYAIGQNSDSAARAGIPVYHVLVAVYVICGLCVGIGAFVGLSQQGSASTEFGKGMEFQAIAAAVLGGTSLFGGRGGVFGVLFGAILMKTVTNGLTIVGADEYIYDLVIASIIFSAVLIDSFRSHFLAIMHRSKIRVEDFEST